MHLVMKSCKNINIPDNDIAFLYLFLRDKDSRKDTLCTFEFPFIIINKKLKNSLR